MSLNATASEWTAERFERAKALWLDGKSASEVARTINEEFRAGGRVSRCAVLGKLYRAGLTVKGGVIHQPASDPRKPTMRRNGKGLVGPVRAPTRTETPIEVVVRPPQGNASAKVLAFSRAEKPADAPAGSKPLLALTYGDCRWIVAGTGVGAMFCGAAAVTERPYCRRHCNIAYQPTGSAKELDRSLRRWTA